MTLDRTNNDEFLQTSTLRVSLICTAILAPFSVNDFFAGRPHHGVFSVGLLCIVLFNVWTIKYRGVYYSSLAMVTLVPSILALLALTLHEQGIIGVFWCYPAAVAFYFVLPERKAWIANAALFAVTMPLAWQVVDQLLAIRIVATLTMVSFLAAVFVRVISSQQVRLQTLASIDPLTGLFNRSSLEDSLEEARQTASTSDVPMSLLNIDIDHFKLINDRLGHAAGDDVLRELGQLFRDRLRKSDRIFRIGGEEFLVILHGTRGDEAAKVAEALRQSVSGLSRPDRPVTVSIGVSTLRPDESSWKWMKRSDTRMYEAKAAGRDRIVARSA